MFGVVPARGPGLGMGLGMGMGLGSRVGTVAVQPRRSTA